MNFVSMLAKILRDKTVRTVGGQKPTNGNIDMSAYATLNGSNSFTGINDFSAAPKLRGQVTAVRVHQRALLDTDDLYTTITEDGIYTANGGLPNIANWPSNAQKYGQLERKTVGSVVQLTWTTYNGVWNNYFSGSPAVWQGWLRVATSNDIDDLDARITKLEAKINTTA